MTRFSSFYLSKVPGKYFLLNIGKPEIPYTKPLELNETGSRIYTLLDQGYEIEKIIDLFVTEYGLSIEQSRDDVNFFIEQLRNFGLPV